MRLINRILFSIYTKFFLLVFIILLSIIIYQQTPRYQYKVKSYIEKEEFKKMREILERGRIRKHNEAVRGRYDKNSK